MSAISVDPSDPGPRVRAQIDQEVSPRREWLRRLAAANRTLIDGLIGTQQSDDELAAMAEAMEALAAKVECDRPRSSYQGMAEAGLAGGSLESFFDMSPLIGLGNPLAPPILIDFGADEVIGRVTFTSAYEGPPGCVHGGYIAAAFDEVLGAAQTYSGSPGMTARLKVNYRRPTPLHAPLKIHGAFDRKEGRKVFANGKIIHDGKITAEAEALFVSLDAGRFAELAEQFNRRVGGEGSD